MAARSSSRSSGEILSSDSEKATTSPPSRNSNNIDRLTRPTPSSTPRSPAIRSRSRSRSPYRGSRGEKRRRDEDYHGDRSRRDPRTFNVRYEDDRTHRRNHSHGDYDPVRPRPTGLHYEDEDERRYPAKRPRTRSRSRSPYRHGRDGRRLPESSREDRGRDGHRRDRSFDTRRGDGDRLKPSVSDRSTAPRTTESSKTNAETSHDQNLQTRAENDVHAATFVKTTSENTELPENSRTETDVSSEMVDEAALIEERRKRREAIKNKYRGHGTPLLVQALHTGAGNASAASTPKSNHPKPSDMSASAGEDSPLTNPSSPAPSAPETPRDNSGLQSPADLSFDQEDLANSDTRMSDGEADEPSAADYDPTVDMQEERARHDRRLFKEDEASSVKADQKAIEQINHGHSPVHEASQSKKPKDEFDMFAEEDDDMFAEAPLKPSHATGGGAQAAQALDVNMMDDWDDSEGYYNTILGELIQNRYHVTQNLGRGMFSSVVRATDRTTGHPVAIKIVRNNDTMRKAGVKEIDILKDIASNDPEDKKHVIRLHGSFDHKGHLCMVFENLSLNLREVLKKFGRDIGINLKAIRAYSQQLFLGLSLLKKCQYLHADLKPDNILVNEARSLLKICDLGSASPVTENVTAPYLVSRFYRAPEIILGIPYDYGIDMWSIGCTLFELYTGKILFTGRNNNAMLRAIMECRGKFPHKLLRRGALSYEYFDDLLNFQSQEQDKITGKLVTKMIDIKAKPVRGLRERVMPRGKRMEDGERKELELFVDLLEKCLDLRPDKRITPSEALKHPFILRLKG